MVAYMDDSKHKKLFFSAPERPRTVLNAFLECMYVDKMTVIYAYGRCLYGRTSLIWTFLECLYLVNIHDVARLYTESIGSNRPELTYYFR